MKKFLLLTLFLIITKNVLAASMNVIGEEGNSNNVDRIIEIKMYDNYFKPNFIEVKKGETIKFIVHNLGEMVHEYNIATKEMHLKHQPEMQKMVEHEILLADRIDKVKMKEMSKKDHAMAHKHENSLLLEPKQKGQIIWKFNTDANLEIACNVPGHYQLGMISKLIKLDE